MSGIAAAILHACRRAAPGGYDHGMPLLATVGHSVLTPEALVALLSRHAVAQVADVRRFPASRRQPALGGAALAPVFAAAGIGYRWFPELGGRRRPDKTSIANTAWRVEAFRAYADHLATDEGTTALAALDAWARERTTAIMCAEALWTRCHRRLIADAFVARGWAVEHLMSPTRREPHKLPEFAVVAGERVRYPAPA